LQPSLHLRRATLVRGAFGADNTGASRFFILSFAWPSYLSFGRCLDPNILRLCVLSIQRFVLPSKILRADLPQFLPWEQVSAYREPSAARFDGQSPRSWLSQIQCSSSYLICRTAAFVKYKITAWKKYAQESKCLIGKSISCRVTTEIAALPSPFVPILFFIAAQYSALA